MRASAFFFSFFLDHTTHDHDATCSTALSVVARHDRSLSHSVVLFLRFFFCGFGAPQGQRSGGRSELSLHVTLNCVAPIALEPALFVLLASTVPSLQISGL